MAAGPMPPAEQREDSTLLSEGFEGSFPAGVWTVSDSNPAFGADQWSTTNYRSSTGARSAWAAGAGNRTEDVTAFTDDFESGGWDWSSYDSQSSWGDDYWGLSDVQAHSGSYSFWNAQYGFNDNECYCDNTEYGEYDSGMETYLVRSVDLTGWATATLDFWYWMDTEPGYDYFYVAYFEAGEWNQVAKRDGNSGGWQQDSVDIPPTATEVGFYFYSDDYTLATGVYVDDVTLSGTTRVFNSASHLYDDGMDTTLQRNVDFSGYTWAHVDYDYWIDSEVGHDYLQVAYYTDMWHYVDTHEGVSGGWAAASVEIPLGSTKAGFRFVSDDSSRAEGAYVDNLRFVGAVALLTCTAGVSPGSGIEGITPFVFSPSPGGGLLPLTWSWSFGDGGSSTAGNPTHTINEAGTYSATVTIRDRLGQTCISATPPIEVNHDTSIITVTPPYEVVTEGQSVVFSAFDAMGHLLAFSLSVDPESCGSATIVGSAAVFVSSDDAGGLTCTVSASIDGHVGVATVEVLHDTSTPSAIAASPTVVESRSVAVQAFDTFGHALSVGWTASCGRVDPGSGPDTVFTATTAGGKSCRVTAQAALASAGVDIAVTHDVSEMSISPSHALLLEGQSVHFTIVDKLGHSIDAAWSVSPDSCGGVAPASGSETTFSTALTAGGLACTVTGSVGGVAKSAEVNVSHDWSSGSVEPVNSVVEEGNSLEYTVRDANGHVVSVAWSLTPAACGSITPVEGPTTTFTAAVGAAGLQCTVTAAGGTLTLRSSALVQHAPPLTMDVTTGDLEAGRAATATAVPKDTYGHALPGHDVQWTTDCAGVSPATGASVNVLAAATAAGTTCHLTATDGAATKTVDVRVLYARPFTVQILPASSSPGGGSTQQVEVNVTDAVGNPVDASEVTWTSSCGSVTGSGKTVTFTAPASGSCTLSASVPYEGAQSTGSTNVAVKSSGSSTVLLLVAAAAVVAVAAGFFIMKKRGPKKDP